MLSCKMCLKKFNTLKVLTSHLKLFHKFSESYPCPYISCPQNFYSTYSLQKHYNLQHVSLNNRNSDVSIKNNLSELRMQSNFKITENIRDCSDEATDSMSKNCVISNSDITDYAVSYLTRLYSNPTVTRKIIQEVVENTYSLLNDIFSNLEQNLLTHFQTLPHKDILHIKKMLTNNPLENMLTEHNRFKYLEGSKHFIKAMSINIGNILDDKKVNGQTALTYKTCEAQVVPIKEVLKKFFEIGDVLSTILEYISKESENTDSITSIFNSSLWQNTITKFPGKVVLPLLLFFDDFECGNPLGTHAGIYKLGGVYLSVGGIPPQFSSRLENIFLLSLFYSSDRTTLGNRAVFTNILQQLQYLEQNGIVVKTSKGDVHVYFTLFLILGDNLGVNSLTGMVESFSANYFCRICTASKEICQTLCEENITILRTPENYFNYSLTSDYGIKERCVFHDLPNFHCVVNVCCDVMHDMLEGVCRYDMARILNYFIFTKKEITLEILNKRIKYFNYDQDIDIGNRIPLIVETQIKKGCIIMSASEMMAFLVYFPFLVGDLLDTDDDHWTFFLKLYDILHIVMAEATSIPELSYLKHVIREHHEMFILLFNENLKPKFHLLLHYPNVIRSVGPLRFLSSMRYEAFHRLGKVNAHIINSRKNITYTLALRYQLKLCYRLQSNIGLLDNINCGKIIDCYHYDDLKLINKLSALRVSHQNVFFVHWMKYNGIVYKKGCVIQYGRDYYGDPLFAQIEVIICADNTYTFYCKCVSVLAKDTSLKCYEIVLNDKSIIVNFNHLNNLQSSKIHIIPGQPSQSVISVFNQD